LTSENLSSPDESRREVRCVRESDFPGCHALSCGVRPRGLLQLPDPLELLRPADVQRDDLRSSIPHRRWALADQPEVVQPVHAVSFHVG
jgi:hypothetical protein